MSTFCTSADATCLSGYLGVALPRDPSPVFLSLTDTSPQHIVMDSSLFWWPDGHMPCAHPPDQPLPQELPHKTEEKESRGEIFLFGLGLLIYHQKYTQAFAQLLPLLEICFCFRQEHCPLFAMSLCGFRFIYCDIAFT